MRRNMFLAVSFLAGFVASTECVVNEGEKIDLTGQEVLLTLLHTSDTHSRLLPYELEVGEVDRSSGWCRTTVRWRWRGWRTSSSASGSFGSSLWIDTGIRSRVPIFNFRGGGGVPVLSRSA